MVRHRFYLRCVPGFNGDDLRHAVAQRTHLPLHVSLTGLTEVVVDDPLEDAEVGEVLSFALYDLLVQRGEASRVEDDTPSCPAGGGCDE